jgi:hypothetical protein
LKASTPTDESRNQETRSVGAQSDLHDEALYLLSMLNGSNEAIHGRELLTNLGFATFN